MLVLWVTMVGEAGALIGSGQKGRLSSCQVVFGQVVNKSTLGPDFSKGYCIPILLLSPQQQHWLESTMNQVVEQHHIRDLYIEKVGEHWNNLVSGIYWFPARCVTCAVLKISNKFGLLAKIVAFSLFAVNTNFCHRTGNPCFSSVRNSFNT